MPADRLLITAARLDAALANVSDVPTVEVENGTPTITFSGNYEAPHADLLTFLFHLMETDSTLAQAAKDGLVWRDGFYGGYGTATLNGLRVEGTSRYTEAPEDDEDDEDDDDLVTCDSCPATSESGWGDTPLCLDCQRAEDPSLVCEEHQITTDGTCSLDHAVVTA